MRTSGIRLRAETGEFKRDVDGAAKSVGGLRGEVDQVAAAAPKMKTSLDGSGRAARAAARDVDEMRDDLAKLDRQIAQTDIALTSLAKAFARTGDVKLLDSIRKQQSALQQLRNVRKLLPDPDPGSAQSWGRKLMQGITAGGLEVSKAAGSRIGITIAAAAGVAAAPVLAGALSAAVSAGVGAAALGAGLALAARDPVIKARATEIGHTFADRVNLAAVGVFRGPMMQGLDRVDGLANRTAARIEDAFRAVAPHLLPQLDKLIAAGDRIGDSLADAARTSGPALDALGDSVTLLSKGVTNVIDTLSSGGPQAASNLRLIAGATADVVTQTGNFLSVLNKISNNSWITGPLLPLLRKHYDDAAGAGRKAGSGSFAAADGIAAAGTAAGTAVEPQRKFAIKLNDVQRAALGQRSALVDLSNTTRAQFDPVMALIEAQKRFRQAEDNATEAVKKHGRNSKEARAASLNLASAAIDLTGKAGALGDKFNGKLSPSMRTVLHNAGLTEKQIDDVAGAFKGAKTQGDKFAKRYAASVWLNDNGVGKVLAQYVVLQTALKKGVSMGNARALAGDEASARDRKLFDRGGWTGPGDTYDPAGVVHADEFVVRKKSRRRFEQQNPGVLDHINRHGELPPTYDVGGVVLPYRVTDRMTRIPSRKEVEAAVVPAMPAGGQTYRWIEAAARALVGAVRVISDYRPGAVTSSGTRSLHADGDAVDFAPSMQLARKWNQTYGRITTEEITPWRAYDLWRGRPHHYSAQLHAEHSGPNAHVHIGVRGHKAYANGGTVTEPILGVGASGRTYSFGENWQRERVIPERQLGSGNGGGNVTYKVVVNVAALSHPAETGRQVVAAIKAYEKNNGPRWRS